MTRLLTPHDYGILNIFVTYVSIFAVIFTLNLHVGIGRYFHEQKEDFDSYLGTSLLLPVVLLSITFIVSCLFPAELAMWLDLPIITIFFFTPFVLNDVLGSIHLQVFRAKRDSKKVKSLSIFTGYTSFVISVVLVYLWQENRYEGKLWAGLIMLVITSVIVFKRIWPFIKIQIKKAHVRYMFSYSVPLIPAYLSGFILAQFDRVMIGNYLGKAEAGQYSFAYNISMLEIMLMNAFLNSWSPQFYKLMNEKNYAKRDKEFGEVIAIFGVVTCGLILFSDWIGYILGAKSFHKSLFMIPIIVLGQFFLGVLPIYKWNISYEKKTYYSSIIILLAGVLNVVLNAIYIPKLGAIAGAYTTLIAYTFQCVLTYFVVRFFLKTVLTPLSKLIPVVVIVVASCAYYYLDLYYIEAHIAVNTLLKISVFIFCIFGIYHTRIIQFIKTKI